ncbi:MAG: type II toxin-antitoxin system VapC family toxin [Nitrososphaerota archaeon]|nr:type II toxin-antitoxin system VapC family toxin [Nitrososphaerota archaeon]
MTERKSMSSFVIDTHAWVEYLIGSRAGEEAKEFIERGGAYTPSVVVTELAKWYLREIEAERISADEMKEHLEFVSSVTVIVPLDESLARKAGEMDFMMKKRAKGWPLADSIVYATAREYRAKVVSGDPHFKGLDDVEFIGAR